MGWRDGYNYCLATIAYSPTAPEMGGGGERGEREREMVRASGEEKRWKLILNGKDGRSGTGRIGERHGM